MHIAVKAKPYLESGDSTMPSTSMGTSVEAFTSASSVTIVYRWPSLMRMPSNALELRRRTCWPSTDQLTSMEDGFNVAFSTNESIPSVATLQHQHKALINKSHDM